MVSLLTRLSIVLLLLLTSCTDWIDIWDVWEIKKGKHISNRTGLFRVLPSLKSGRSLRFDCYFTSSALYDTAGMGIDAYDINKLYGFTDANSLVHDNSIRIGWRHNGAGIIEIFAYWYAGGKRGIEKLGETMPYIQDEYELRARNGYYYFRFNNKEFSTNRKVDAEHGIRVRLFPYFGGNKSAPNDIRISIREHDL